MAAQRQWGQVIQGCEGRGQSCRFYSKGLEKLLVLGGDMEGRKGQAGERGGDVAAETEETVVRFRIRSVGEGKDGPCHRKDGCW